MVSSLYSQIYRRFTTKKEGEKELHIGSAGLLQTQIILSQAYGIYLQTQMFFLLAWPKHLCPCHIACSAEICLLLEGKLALNFFIHSSGNLNSSVFFLYYLVKIQNYYSESKVCFLVYIISKATTRYFRKRVESLCSMTCLQVGFPPGSIPLEVSLSTLKQAGLYPF